MNDSAPTAREIAAGLGQRKGGRIQVCPPEERTWNGVVFASGKEMDFYKQFESMEKLGAIRNLRRQVKFVLHTVTPGGFKVPISSYKADIVCEDRDGKTCIYEPKGHQTAEYKRTKKWFEAEYGMRILEL